MQKLKNKQGYDFYKNGFTLIRYISAVAVMVGHYLTYAMEPFETSEIYSSMRGGILLNWLGNILAAIRGVSVFWNKRFFDLSFY